MAIEDEIINISDIDIGAEILRTDKLLVETNNGTKLVEFKDFVIGTENISFYNVISSAFLGDNITGAAQYQSLSGFNLLSPGTNAGYKTSYEHVSGAIELTKVNNSAVSELATVSGKIATNESALQALQTSVAGIYDTLEATGNDALKTVTKSIKSLNEEIQLLDTLQIKTITFPNFGTFDLNTVQIGIIACLNEFYFGNKQLVQNIINSMFCSQLAFSILEAFWTSFCA